ncbi:CBO0543 family protein [Alicyclobacillus ferrooxydans]|uniref:Uncharacterized protein n=1 Tax=Alicyclobacillus ferrooxydans TaxID=471514 RepID=A0A0P9C2R7_9BACL|nr:hypothetical protein AN477_23225 [Alicyclobacillus ferrooxydans]
MFHLIASVIWILIAWRWGDWRNWRNYQSTILYLITCDLVYNLMTYKYTLWVYTPAFPLPNDTGVSLLVMFVIYPCTLLIYLPHYPKGWWQILYILLWAGIWSCVEWVLTYLHLLLYQHGWIFGYSVAFDIVAFSMLRLHYKKPLLTYALSLFATIALVLMFHVPVSSMK